MLREPVAGGAVVEAELRSRVEDRWRAAYQHAGSSDPSALRDAGPELLREDSAVLRRSLHHSAAAAAPSPASVSGNEWCSWATTHRPRSLRSPSVSRNRLSG